MNGTDGPINSDPIAVLAQYRDDRRPIWLWDSLRARILWANLAALKFWGEISTADLSLRDLGRDSPLSVAVNAESNRLKRGQRARRAVVLTPRDQPHRMVLDLAPYPLPDYSGAVLVVAGASTVEQAGRQRLEDIFHHIPVPLTLFGPDGRPLMQNQAADGLFGPVDPDTRQQSFFRRMVHSEHARMLYAVALTNGTAARVTTLITTRGKERHRIVLHRFTDPKAAGIAVLALYEEVPTSIASLSRPAGVPGPSPKSPAAPPETAGVTPGIPGASDDGVQTDIQRALMSALEAVGIGIITLNRDGDIKAINTGAAAILGIEPAEALGKRFAAYLSKASGHRISEFLRSGPLSPDGDFLKGADIIGINGQNEELPLTVTIRPIPGSGEERYCVIFRDISDWKSVLGELDQIRGEGTKPTSQSSAFLANVSHEIRTPLNAILGFTELMQRETFGPIGNEKYVEYLGDIKDSGARVLSLINDLLDLSKTEAGRMDLHFEPLDVGPVIAASERFVGPQVLEAKISMESHIDPGLPPLRADGRALSQIFVNLLSNAVKATPEGGRILTTARLDDSGSMLIEVRDSGVGMTPEQIRTALEPYGQPLNTITSERSGTGLGLPLAKALTEAHGARLTISSAPGEGTVIRLTFPMETPPEE